MFPILCCSQALRQQHYKEETNEFAFQMNSNTQLHETKLHLQSFKRKVSPMNFMPEQTCSPEAAVSARVRASCRQACAWLAGASRLHASGWSDRQPIGGNDGYALMLCAGRFDLICCQAYQVAPSTRSLADTTCQSDKMCQHGSQICQNH